MKRATVVQRELNRQSMVRLRNERRAAGLCYICGGERAEKRYAACDVCRGVRRIKSARELPAHVSILSDYVWEISA